jgi:hypothetical protein
MRRFSDIPAIVSLMTEPTYLSILNLGLFRLGRISSPRRNFGIEGAQWPAWLCV